MESMPGAVEVAWFQQIALLAFLVACAYTDASRGVIPDRLTVPAAVAGILTHGYLGGTGLDRLGSVAWILQPRTLTPSLADSLLGMGVGAGVLMALYAAGGMGLGDVKMMGAVGALGGVRFCLQALVWTSLAGALLAAASLARQGRLAAGLAGSVRWAMRRGGALPPDQAAAARQTIPYGVAISAGTMTAWLLEIS